MRKLRLCFVRGYGFSNGAGCLFRQGLNIKMVYDSAGEVFVAAAVHLHIAYELLTARRELVNNSMNYLRLSYFLCPVV